MMTATEIAESEELATAPKACGFYDDKQGWLVFDASLIASGESNDQPSVEHLAALISEIRTLSAIVDHQSRQLDEYGFQPF